MTATMPDTAKTTIANLTYEQALTELDGLIERLERGDVALADAVAFYERGAKLAEHCGQLLDRTEAQITELTVTGAGAVRERPLSAETGTTGGNADLPSPFISEPRTASAGRDSGPPINPDDIPF